MRDGMVRNRSNFVREEGLATMCVFGEFQVGMMSLPRPGRCMLMAQLLVVET